jgi:hypothetical protein
MLRISARSRSRARALVLLDAVVLDQELECLVVTDASDLIESKRVSRSRLGF